jgi:hypothetical protein
MMGRVNIAFSLIRKDIYAGRIIAALRGILARRRGDLGELNFSYVALLSMFAKSKKLSYEDLIKLLINKENPSKSAYKTLLSRVRLPYIENVLAKLCRGEVPRLGQSLMISMIYEIDSLYLIKALWTPIKSFFKRYDPETMERTEFDGILLNSQLSVLAKEMLLSMLQPSSSEIEAGVYPGDSVFLNRFDNPAPGSYEGAVCELIDFYTFFLSRDECEELRSFAVVDTIMKYNGEIISPLLTPRQVLEKCPDPQLLQFIDKFETVESIDDMFRMQGLIDRYNELLRLVERARSKSADSPPSNVKQDSPLKVLSFMAKSRKGRPLFSYFDEEAFKKVHYLPASWPRK